MKYIGFYINLDRNPERRQGIEEELARNGLGGLYTRFPASNGNELKFPNPRLKEGEIGCFTSHYRLLMANKDNPLPLHVIEDDIVLSPQVGPLLDKVVEGGELAKYDIVYTDVAVPVSNTLCMAYKAFYDANVKRDKTGKIESVTYSIIDMREMVFASTCSFLVNPQSIGKLAALYEDELKRGARVPIDIFIRKMCQDGVLKVVCIFPFITSIPPESCFASTMEKRFDEMPALASNMLRHSFYIGCDWGRLKEASRIFPQPESSDQHRQLMLRLLGYCLTPEYERL